MRLNNWFLVLLSLFASSVRAEDVKFFEGDIDYWSEAETKPLPKPEAKSIESAKPVAEVRPTFDWKNALDPQNEDFFREGDYVPPAPFMEVARNPSDENIRLWNAYIAKKNELAARLERRLREYAAGNASVKTAPQPLREPKVPVEVSPKRFQFRLYFDSQCPHCKRMMQSMSEIAGQGFSVEAKQIDNLPFETRGWPFPFSKASTEEVKRQAINSVPFLLVADIEKNVVYKIGGYKSSGEILEGIAAGARR